MPTIPLQVGKKRGKQRKMPAWLHSAGLRGMLCLPWWPRCTLATASGFAKPLGFLHVALGNDYITSAAPCANPLGAPYLCAVRRRTPSQSHPLPLSNLTSPDGVIPATQGSWKSVTFTALKGEVTVRSFFAMTA
jgi:hypothetical protein